MSLEGKCAVVTGGSQGIGKAIAAGLRQQGAKVTIMGRTAAALQQTAESLDIKAVICDVTQPDSVKAAFAQCDRVDILVNNAGNAVSAPFHQTSSMLWQQMIDVNLNSVYYCTQAVICQMVARRYGRIINIASTAALTGYAYVAAYCAAKHGVVGLTRALALEVATKGVTVNAICPGYTDTPMIANSIARIVEKTGRSENDARSELIKNNPQGRLVAPEEVAHSVLWLCMPGSDSITGQAIAVAGGEIL